MRPRAVRKILATKQQGVLTTKPDLVQDRFHEGGKTRNVALQLVL